VRLKDYDARHVVEVVGMIEWWNGRKAREVIAAYTDDQRRREIELEVNGSYQPRFVETDR